MKTHHAAAIGLLCCVGAATAADADPIKVELRLAGGPYAAEGCTGGDWSIRWKGELPSEGSSIADMLISYSAFDTTLEEGRSDPPAQIDATPIVCRDSEGKLTFKAHLAGGTRKIRGVIALKHDPVAHSPGFWFSVDDAGVCHHQAADNPGMAVPTLVEIQPVLGSVLTPALQLTRKDLQDGFEKRYRISGAVLTGLGACLSSPLTAGELLLSYKRQSTDPSITLDGCAALPVGQSTTVSAAVEPPGGILRFWAEPAAALSTQSLARSARVSAVAPGKGTIKAEYTVDGKTATAELPAAGLKLNSINGGAPIPKLGLLDVDGKPNNKVYSFPYDLESADASDMIRFELGNGALASVQNGRGSVGLQAVNEGRTTLQAKTRCAGQTLGHAVEVEVVPCDDEVRAELTRRLNELKEREIALLKKIQQFLSSDEFDRAAREIGKTTAELATKTAELIAATLTGGEATAVQKGLSVGKDLQTLQRVQDVWDLRNALNDYRDGKTPAAAIGVVVVALRKWQASMLKSFIEAGLAAEKLGQDLGTIAGVTEAVESLSELHDRVLRDRHRIESVLARCRKEPPPAPPSPPKRADPKPPKPRTPPPADVPPTDAPPAGTPPVDAPPPGTPPEPPPVGHPPPLAGGWLCERPADDPGFTAAELRDLTRSVIGYRNGLRAGADAQSSGAALTSQVQAADALREPARSQRLATFGAPIDNFLGRFYQAGEMVAAPEHRFDACRFTLPAWLGTLRTRY